MITVRQLKEFIENLADTTEVHVICKRNDVEFECDIEAVQQDNAAAYICCTTYDH